MESSKTEKKKEQRKYQGKNKIKNVETLTASN
jgi:hypothetical protein